MFRKASVILSLLFLTPLCFHASGATYIVNDTNDTTRIVSLRGAIIAANRAGGRNTIIIGRSLGFWNKSRQWVYRLTIPGANERASLTGDLNINRGEMTIIGMSSDVTIDATGLGDRVFDVSPNAKLTLENVTIKGGTAASNAGILGGGQFGGAICNSGTLILEQCVIVNNASGAGQPLEGNGGGTSGGDGGGIYNNGRLQANNCIIAGNTCGAGFDGAPGGNGGGIRNDGYCSLSECAINVNQAGAGGGPDGNFAAAGGNGGNGGGIFNFGTLMLNECIIAGNTAGFGTSAGEALSIAPGGWGGSGGSGGGIYNLSKLQIDFSTVFDNNTGDGGNGGNAGVGGNPGVGGNGGGIFNAGELNLNTSTISSNWCGNGGDGGYGSVFGGAAGGAGGSGGGLYNMGISPGSIQITSSTITLNECGAGGNGPVGESFSGTAAAPGGDAGDGGGVANAAGINAIMVRNTLIAQNLPNVGGAPATNITYGIEIGTGQPINVATNIGNPGADTIGFDLAGAFTSDGFNLIAISDGSTGFMNAINGDKAGTEANPLNPLLGPLQMNGGFAPTHALLSGSPALDQGKCFGIHRDQRGQRRPQIFPSISRPQGGDGSDIGAFEVESR
ncbi:MAG TPA: choice-of-anchor Q domain-containing protein [Verrucomicrobiae bacterium]|nr:choice-of-anchor Q domain-containing protein [Verrucomicrobiae bacterium]